jgi:Cu+-exporting ATPase
MLPLATPPLVRSSHTSTEAIMAIDPVCNMEVDEETAPGHTVYDGMDFYFCSLTCQQKFEHDPGQYVDVEAA